MVYASKNETYFGNIIYNNNKGNFYMTKDTEKGCIHMQIKMFIPENGHMEKKMEMVLTFVLKLK